MKILNERVVIISAMFGTVLLLLIFGLVACSLFAQLLGVNIY